MNNYGYGGGINTAGFGEMRTDLRRHTGARLLDAIKKLFGKRSIEPPMMAHIEDINAFKYRDISRTNFTAIVSNKMANKTIGESGLDVIGEGDRAEYVRKALESVWANIKNVVSTAYGIGGCAVVPYLYGTDMYCSMVPGNQFFITAMAGADIVSCAVKCDERKTRVHTYSRIAEHTVKDGVYTIRNTVIDENNAEHPLSVIKDWESIPEEVVITGVDRLPVAYIKCPANPRRPMRPEGVPITYGCDEVITDILNLHTEYRMEYNLKRTFVGVDQTMVDKDGQLSSNGLFKRILTNGGKVGQASGMEVFSPDIRQTAYHERMAELYALLENQIGTSSGVLTRTESSMATATEIKQANLDTKSMVALMQTEIDRAVDTIAYAAELYADLYGVRGESPEVNVAWDMSLWESSTETFSQMVQAATLDAISAAEVRRFITGESQEEAEEAVAKIKAENPTTEQLFGI